MSTVAEKTATVEVVKTSLSTMKAGNTFRSAGSQKKWMVVEVNLTAEPAYVHVINDKVNYKLKGKCVTEEIYVLIDTNGDKIPTKSSDDWTKQMISRIKEIKKPKVTKPKAAEAPSVQTEATDAPPAPAPKPKKKVVKKGGFEAVMETHNRAASQKADK